VKTLALAKSEDSPHGTTEPADVYAGRYPLSRFLYVYVNKAPNRPLDPLVEQFLRYALSREGQETVVKDGYLPVSKAVVDGELAKLN
jgi:phosphate transport system substrate-binding protein